MAQLEADWQQAIEAEEANRPDVQAKASRAEAEQKKRALAELAGQAQAAKDIRQQQAAAAQQHAAFGCLPVPPVPFPGDFLSKWLPIRICKTENFLWHSIRESKSQLFIED